jgi:hypothetical protein
MATLSYESKMLAAKIQTVRAFLAVARDVPEGRERSSLTFTAERCLTRLGVVSPTAVGRRGRIIMQPMLIDTDRVVASCFKALRAAGLPMPAMYSQHT